MSTLYIVATPIGNLADMTYRAVEILQQVDGILAEDTRHAKSLLQHYTITTPLQALHDHNERQKADYIIAQLQAGQSLALISDAGTPLISDPGYVLVHAAREAGISVVPIPGACAVITALSASGLPTDQFSFRGFLPAKSTARVNVLEKVKTAQETVLVYESTHRLLASLTDVQAVLGDDRQLVLAKELTKQFEAFVVGNVETIVQWLHADPARQKGEFVLLIAPNKTQAQNQEVTVAIDTLLAALQDHVKPRPLAKVLANLSGYDAQTLYAKICTAKKE